MVIGEEAAVIQQPPTTMPPANIDNIMSGIGNTGTVKMNNHRKKLRQRFDIIKKLGQGTYGKVQLGINKETGQEVAIKTIKKCKIETEADLIRIRREVQIMSSVQHPNIIHIYEVFENKEKMVLVMEFAAGGELYDYLSERKVLTEEEARRVFRQISTAIYYCHKHKICHRDLKLENILLDEHGNAKIADFGLSNVFDEQRLLATFCGSPLYASPEIVKGTPYQGPEVDCWSLGVLLYTLVYGAMPFDGSNFKRLVKQISQGEYYEPKKASAASPLIREMLTVCPKRRATIENICNHWWVNEGYDESCLDLAEELANQTPVRLDVLLSLSPPSVTAEQLVVPAPVQESKSSDRVSRSHSVGSVIDMANTEAERRIIDMVTQGGEAALMPSPTRTITPAESPAQPKRKLETTVSTENATGAVKKREKSFNPATASKLSIAETMEIDQDKTPTNRSPAEDVIKATDLDKIENACDELMASNTNIKPSPSKKVVKKKDITPAVPASAEAVPQPQAKPIDAPITGKGETSPQAKENPPAIDPSQQSAAKALEARRKSKVFETAEKFQNMNAQNTEKAKKFGASIGNVGNFKKEFEKKASLTGTNLAATAEQAAAAPKSPEKKIVAYPKVLRKTSLDDSKISSTLDDSVIGVVHATLEGKTQDSKSSLANFSLEEARKSMENSIALLNQAKNESSKEVDQLCAQTENVTVNENDREKKLRSARDIIGNAIQPGRLCMGVRKPPVPFGLNGRSISGSVLPSSTGYERKPLRVQVGPEPSDLATATYSVSTPEQKLYTQDPLTGLHRPIAVATVDENPEFDDTPKTSRAEITLKSATLPRRKPAKPDVKLEIETKPTERGMRFSTEMQHQVPDLRSAPIREHPYSPITTGINQRATSLEPQQKEIIIPIQRPPRILQQQPVTPVFRQGSLSRQSTNESDTETTITTPTLSSTATLASSSSTTQPIKKSPREFIIPIAVEGGGYITPRAGSLEPSESNTTTNTTGTSFSKIGRPRRMGSLLNESNLDEESPFTRLHRHTSIGRDSDNEEPRFHTMHRLRSTRPIKRVVQDPNDSASSGDDDDEDGFEILTAENLFSTLLSRVRALTNRMNVNDTHGFPTSRLMSNLRQPHSSFWHHDPFASNLNNSSSSWRHTISRDLGSDIDSMFSRSGATLPRGTKFRASSTASNNNNVNSSSSSNNNNNNNNQNSNSNSINSNDNNNNNNSGSNSGKLDLQDLDLSRLRLTKKDLETLSSLTPSLPKEVQEQLLAQLPPNQARKLSRTLSMQNNLADSSGGATTATGSNHIKPYKRSLSGGRDLCDSTTAAAVASSRVLGAKNVTPSRNDIFDRNSVYRRSLSKTRYDVAASAADSSKINSRSSSRCRDSVGDITDESSRSYLSDVSKYKSYRSSDYDNSSSTLSPTNDCYTNLPPLSGCISPPPLPNDVTMRRRSTTKRISRFLRPDFFDTPREESIYVGKDNKDRDPESRRLLKEIRERSRERSLDRTRGASTDRLSYLMEKYKKNEDELGGGIQGKYTRHSSVDGFCDSRENLTLLDHEKRRRSLSKSRDHQEFSDKIINELQTISQQRTEAEKNEKSKLTRNKSANKVENNVAPQPETDKINDIKMVTNLTKEIDSIGMLNLNGKPSGKESKLTRPKSYPNKSNEKLSKKVAEAGLTTAEPSNASPIELKSEDNATNKVVRPKSFPNSKITPPKDVKKSEAEQKPIVTAAKPAEKTSKIKQNGVVTIGESGEKKTVKKVIRTVKKTIKGTKSEDSSEKTDEKLETAKPVEKKADSPEKKVSKGFLYSIGQKFEKFRDGGKSKEAKKQEESNAEPSSSGKATTAEPAEEPVKKKKTKPSTVTTAATEKKSKIDSMIRNLREKSVPRSPQMTESRLLKRAVSVEDMTNGGYNKSGVNKVLGLFKKYEKDSITQQNVAKLKNTKSSSNVDFDLETAGNTQKNRKSLVNDPPSVAGNAAKPSGRKPNQYLGAKSDSILTLTDQLIQKSQLPTSVAAAASIQTTTAITKIPKVGCNECGQSSETSETQIIKRHSNNSNNISNGSSTNETETEKEKLKNKRKALVLDFSKFEANNNNNINNNNNNNVICSNNGNASDVNSFVKTNENSVNNNNISYPPPLPGDRNLNNNHLNTPSYDNLINYTSEPRSPYDDCASTSTLFSPTDEPELYFDNWSVCSEDHPANSGRPTPSSPSTSTRYSRNSTSHLITSPQSHADTNISSESIVDRIRRKSFYSRFNEKKPKRVSTIVGPAAKEYYHPRESSSTANILPSASSSSAVASSSSSKSIKSIKPLEYKRTSSASVRTPTGGGTTHEYYHPMKTSALDNLYSNLSGSSTKLNTSSNPYSHHHHHHHHHHHLPPSSLVPITSSSSKIHSSDYLSPTTYNPSSHHHTSSASLLKKSDNLLNYSTSKRASSIYDGTSIGAPSSSSALSYSNSFNQRHSGGGGHHTNVSSSSSNNNHHSNNLGSSATSSYLNGNLEAYATLGRKIKPYEQRTVSLLNTLTPKLNSKTTSTTTTGGLAAGGNSSGLSGLSSSSNSSQREHRLATDFGTISRNTLRMRTPTNSKSPSAT